MSSNDAPPAPNYQPIADAQMKASEESNKIAQEQLDWAKQTYAENKGNTDKVVDSFLQTQATQNANAATDRQRYQDIFQPQEDKLVADADSYNSPERRDLDMGRAGANVSQNFDAARANAMRDLEGFGIKPDALRYAALDKNSRIQQGAAVAGAQNQAGLADDATARALRTEAINVGRGYPAQVTNETGTGIQAGTGAVNSGNQTFATGSAAMGNPTAWNSSAANSLTGAANTMNTGYSNAMAAATYNQKNNSDMMSGIGGLAGMALFAADGGEIPGGAVPAEVSPTGGKAIDDVPARLTAGEFIMPKKAVEWFGTKHFYGLIEKADKDLAEAKQRTGAVPAVGARRPQAVAVS